MRFASCCKRPWRSSSARVGKLQFAGTVTFGIVGTGTLSDGSDAVAAVAFIVGRDEDEADVEAWNRLAPGKPVADGCSGLSTDVGIDGDASALLVVES